MHESTTNGVKAELARLNGQYGDQLGHTLDDLRSKVFGLGPNLSRDVLMSLHDKLHTLAGSGGIFGFPMLSTQASALEATAKHWLDGSATPSDAQWQAWCDGLYALSQSLTPVRAPSGLAPADTTLPLPGKEKNIRIVLIEDDLAQGKVISSGLSQFGYKVSLYAEFEPALAAILDNPPDALIVDIHLAGPPPLDSTTIVPSIFAKLGYRLPLVFLTARTDFPARIAAAKTGAGDFLSKPVAVPRLAESIERLLREGEETPYRVLIVDDDELLAEHYRLTLVNAGMLAEKVCEPEKVLEAMQALRPDLLLLDLHMPKCTGAELARAIRYSEELKSMTIAFLSAESDLNEQIKAMGSGGDDFFLKPISDRRLIATVRVRAARARNVSDLMSQDSLTGLLKHASIKERLAQEIDRATRLDNALTVAMIDIDYFKKVNDNWGHPTGDQVIKTLGHLLRQRLRRQDSIGRYGGEEFLAVLPDCSAADAGKLLEDIRQRFSEINFVHQGKSFTVTLSAGISCRDRLSSADEMLRTADSALYEAKNGGRNQVQFA